MWLTVVFCVLKVEEDRAQWGLWGRLPEVGDNADLGAATVHSSQKDFPNVCLGWGEEQMCTRPIDAIVGSHGRGGLNASKEALSRDSARPLALESINRSTCKSANVSPKENHLGILVPNFMGVLAKSQPLLFSWLEFQDAISHTPLHGNTVFFMKANGLESLQGKILESGSFQKVSEDSVQ
ncbi:hypothetical protein E2320_012889 [Naja naja]|nr:hypothetical protein E2320_012889 [Naja naja]